MGLELNEKRDKLVTVCWSNRSMENYGVLRTGIEKAIMVDGPVTSPPMEKFVWTPNPLV